MAEIFPIVKEPGPDSEYAPYVAAEVRTKVPSHANRGSEKP